MPSCAALSRTFVAAVVVSMLAACGSGATPGQQTTGEAAGGAAGESVAGHRHGEGENVSLPVGDGTRAYEVGYTLTDLRLPDRAGEPGEIAFSIRDYRGTPHTEFLVEQTKDIHVYVVREDLTVFRHLHPTMDERGHWSGRLTLPEPGTYRVVTEFVARDEGGNGDHVILGDTVEVAGEPSDDAPVATTGAQPIGVTVEDGTRVGEDQRLIARVTDAEGRPVELGTYLGAHAHLTGFHMESGALVHLHPLGVPKIGAEGTRLEFHTAFTEPGRYRLFVQVRVEKFLHTVPVEITVSPRA